MYKFVLLPGSVYINPEIQSSERDFLRKENNYQPYIKLSPFIRFKIKMQISDIVDTAFLE